MNLNSTQIALILDAISFYDYGELLEEFGITTDELKQFVRDLLNQVPEEKKENFQWAVSYFDLQP